ncbi:hypothetical protein M427DRAFT_33787 [Gonapodya prolifera JEL478]|uniref:Uncharacterized protein n=1 Tax=Gonapodya prolifera (strain JEL478) TaxID=1344416 RepID=A0A139AA38_GONPJ|nr:hypothetical protein M427DRAFT_33787 [Gonapodya prolifera JEL478]|eukprot:KXS13597.1 hypothetical protein M427DRAFT_33787 [Gonapodya prolifera JEL478]
MLYISVLVYPGYIDVAALPKDPDTGVVKKIQSTDFALLVMDKIVRFLRPDVPLHRVSQEAKLQMARLSHGEAKRKLADEFTTLFAALAPAVGFIPGRVTGVMYIVDSFQLWTPI